MKNTTRKITYGALIIACAVVLPQLFHLSGIPNSGAVFLPMHIPVLLGGFILGPLFGALVGVLSPLIRRLTLAYSIMQRTLSKPFIAAAFFSASAAGRVSTARVAPYPQAGRPMKL